MCRNKHFGFGRFCTVVVAGALAGILAGPAGADEGLDPTMRVVDDGVSEEEFVREIDLPEQAADRARDAARPGLDTANQARERRREFGEERAGEAREYGREQGRQRAGEARRGGEAARERAREEQRMRMEERDGDGSDRPGGRPGR